MPNRTAQRMAFGRVDRRVIDANFEGGDLSSDGGLMLLRRTDGRSGLTRAAAVFSDARDTAKIRQRLRDLLAQRIDGLCCGYEDLNDHDRLRADLLMFLSDPVDDDGGELAIEDTHGEQRVKLPAGRPVPYPSGSIHEVRPGTRGERLACYLFIQSVVRDAAQRRHLYEVDATRPRVRNDP